jgi:hypothetical protein
MRLFHLLAFGLAIAVSACVAEPAPEVPYNGWYEGPYYPWYNPTPLYWPSVEGRGRYRGWHGGWHGHGHGGGHGGAHGGHGGLPEHHRSAALGTEEAWISGY